MGSNNEFLIDNDENNKIDFNVTELTHYGMDHYRTINADKFSEENIRNGSGTKPNFHNSRIFVCFSPSLYSYCLPIIDMFWSENRWKLVCKGDKKTCRDINPTAKVIFMGKGDPSEAPDYVKDIKPTFTLKTKLQDDIAKMLSIVLLPSWDEKDYADLPCFGFSDGSLKYVSKDSKLSRFGFGTVLYNNIYKTFPQKLIVSKSEKIMNVDVPSSSIAEMLGVIDLIDTYNDTVDKKKKPLVIITDSVYVVKVISTNMVPNPKTSEYLQKLVKKVREMIKLGEFSSVWVKAHTNRLSKLTIAEKITSDSDVYNLMLKTNDFCDKMAKDESTATGIAINNK